MSGAERVAVVTGAASGIGRATALALSRQGARVALCDKDGAGLSALKKTMRGAGQTRMVELDVADQERARRAFDDIVADWGRLDVLVNAAGIASSGLSSRGHVIAITEQDWDRIMDVNLLGTAYC